MRKKQRNFKTWLIRCILCLPLILFNVNNLEANSRLKDGSNDSYYQSKMGNIHNEIFAQKLDKLAILASLDECSRLSRRYPDSYEILLYQSYGHYRLGMYDEAILSATKGLQFTQTRLNQTNNTLNQKNQLLKLQEELESLRDRAKGRKSQDLYRQRIRYEQNK